MGNDIIKDSKKQDTTQQKPDNVPQQKPDNVSQQKPDNVPQQKPDNVSQQKPDNVPQQKPDNVSQRKPKNVSQQKPDNVSQQKPDNVSQRKPKNVPQQKLDASSQQDNLMKASNRRTSRSISRHHGPSDKNGQMKNLNNFFKICDDFENALKTVQICQISKSLVDQRLLNINKILVEKISTLQKSNDDDSTKTRKEKEISSNLRSLNKSLSSSTSNMCSESSSKGLPHLKSCKEFLNEVNCPFCDECQQDKYYLIKHLDEDCLPFMTKSFKIKTHLQYSYFQILPKNNFKCNVCNDVVVNLQGYFKHLNSCNLKDFKSKSSSKPYTNQLFCSVCKFLVPNNCTELVMHLEHQQHVKRSQKLGSEKIFQNKKISCIYYKRGEYYCFACFKKFNKRNNFAEFMNHVMGDNHRRNLEKHGITATKVYCEICDEEINPFKILDHFRSVEHESKALEQNSTQYYTLCVYCSSDFPDLTKLSNHMKSGCKEMEVLRNHGLISGYEASRKSSEIMKGVAGKEELNIDENFFSFAGESSLEKMENQSNQSESDEENDTSDDDSSCNDEQMKNSFQEVGSCLLKNVETAESAEDDEILLISQMTLKATITFSGFRGCQIFVPNEGNINLHCRFENQTYHSILEELVMKQNIRRIGKDSVEVIFGLSQVALPFIEKSPFWEHVECIMFSIPYVKCIHKRTRKSCIISFSDSDRELTDALSACLKENDFIKPFLLTLKLWLSCQKTFLSDIDYPVIAVILFFLMSKSLVRPFLVPEHPVHSKILRALPEDDNALTANTPSKNIAEGDIKKLFKMFLEFMNTFDFKKYAICFPIPRPVPKKILTNMLNDKDYSYSSIWIMNTSCTWNYTADIREKETSSFLNLINKALQTI